MATEENKKNTNSEGRMPPAETGNASNPLGEGGLEPVENNRLIDERGEKYLREVSSPEDYPDDEDWEAADKTLNDHKKD